VPHQNATAIPARSVAHGKPTQVTPNSCEGKPRVTLSAQFSGICSRSKRLAARMGYDDGVNGVRLICDKPMPFGPQHPITVMRPRLDPMRPRPDEASDPS
jgi:hypothetical protein